MKTWETPKLVILVRSKSNEMVLVICKQVYAATAESLLQWGPQDAAPACYVECNTPCSAASGT